MKQMRNIFLYLIIVFFALSCEIDNYEAPDAVLEGIIADANGVGLQLEQGGSSAKIKMEDLSWSDTPIPFYLNFKSDGTYINTKVFAARYAITPVEGPFYPIEAEIIEVKGNTKHDFTVTPYLNVSWIGDPIINSDKTVSAKFKFTRKASPVVGEDMPDLKDYQLFISTTKHVGNNNFDPDVVGGVVSAANDMEGQELTITTIAPMKYSTTYYIRVGVRVNDSFKKYNYTDIKTIVVQ